MPRQHHNHHHLGAAIRHSFVSITAASSRQISVWRNTLCVLLFYTIGALFNSHPYFFIFYNIALNSLLLATIILMVKFLAKMRAGDFPPRDPAQQIIPNSTLICTCMLSTAVCMGYLYFMVISFALNGCDGKSVPATVWFLSASTHFLIALFTFVSTLYIIQRAYADTSDSRFAKVVQNLVNCMLGILFVRFIILKGNFIIEDQCKHHAGMFFSNWVCPYVKLTHFIIKDYKCNAQMLLEKRKIEQHHWYVLNKGLLSATIATCAAELMPVLLTVHWLTCKTQQQHVEEPKIYNGLEMRNFLLGMIRGTTNGSAENHRRRHSSILADFMPTMPLWVRYCALALLPLAIFQWALTLYNYTHDSLPLFFYYKLDNQSDANTARLQFIFWFFIHALKMAMFIEVYCRCIRRMPMDFLDQHHWTNSYGDFYMITRSLAVATFFEALCLLLQEVVTFLNGSLPMLNILFYLPFLISHWLEVFSLQKLMAINRRCLLKLSGTLPLVALANMMLNFTSFFIVYFYMDTQKQKFAYMNKEYEYISLVVWVELSRCIFYICMNLFLFTCSLCWIDVLMRYHADGFFVMNRRTDREEIVRGGLTVDCINT